MRSRGALLRPDWFFSLSTHFTISYKFPVCLLTNGAKFQLRFFLYLLNMTTIFINVACVYVLF